VIVFNRIQLYCIFDITVLDRTMSVVNSSIYWRNCEKLASETYRVRWHS